MPSVPGRRASNDKLNFNAIDCNVSYQEGIKAQRVLTSVLFNRCTIEHTHDVLPPAKLFSVLHGKADLKQALRTAGLLQKIIDLDEDDSKRQPVSLAGFYGIGHVGLHSL